MNRFSRDFGGRSRVTPIWQPGPPARPDRHNDYMGPNGLTPRAGLAFSHVGLMADAEVHSDSPQPREADCVDERPKLALALHDPPVALRA